MAKNSKGARRKTRGILTRRARERGLSPITHTFQRFAPGESATVVCDPSEHRGMPHMRFQGMTGTIQGKQGRSYILQVKVQSLAKTLIVRPEHLRRVG
jgi:large subunit ribosomal protein L21e